MAPLERQVRLEDLALLAVLGLPDLLAAQEPQVLPDHQDLLDRLACKDALVQQAQ